MEYFGQLPAKRDFHFVWWPWLLGLLTILIVLLWYVVEPWPLWLRIANVGSQSFSVGWVTKGETNGCLVVARGNLTKVWQVCPGSTGMTHLIDVIGLGESKTYFVMVRQGLRVYPSTLRRVRTYTTKTSPSGPVPAYGTVTDRKGKRIPYALIYAYPAGGGENYPEATVANVSGNYAFDLGFFGPIQEWILEGGSGPGQWNAEIFSNEIKTPFPPLEVSAYE